MRTIKFKDIEYEINEDRIQILSEKFGIDANILFECDFSNETVERHSRAWKLLKKTCRLFKISGA